MSESPPSADTRRLRPALPILTHALAGAVAVWIAWFITHLPWLALPERTAVIAIVTVWFLTNVAMFVRSGTPTMGRGAITGLLTATIGLLLLGSKIAAVSNATAGGTTSSVVPSAPLIVTGFLVLGTALGLIAALVARLLRPAALDPTDSNSRWLCRLALVTCAAVAPLLLVGGLVTSTDSGMAVPDWPNTFGSNMLLYPLGPRVAEVVGKPYQKVFLEHSHRLFGMLVGLATLGLTLGVIAFDQRRWVRMFVIALFAGVCIQGVLGAYRVNHDSRYLAVVHGFFAHVIFGATVALATVLSPTFSARANESANPGSARRFKAISTALLHTMILQVLLGAGYRQLRSDHVLYTHIALSFVVILLAIMTGAACGSAAPDSGPARTPISRLGHALLIVAVIQFGLGFYAWLVGGKGIMADSPMQVIPRVLHHGTGALLFGLAAATYVWARRVHSWAAPQSPAQQAT